MKKTNTKTISIIIPVINEEKCIGSLLQHLGTHSTSGNIKEILIVDGGSIDKTVAISEKNEATVLHSKKGRAKQMNYGAKKASGDIIYFLHADTFPPKGFDSQILNAIEKGHKGGCFRLKFDNANWFLNFFSWFTRINHRLCRGGDQSLFVCNQLFIDTKGFNEEYFIFEDNEFIARLYKLCRFKIIPSEVTTSTRRYEQNGQLKLQYHFGIIHFKNFFGAHPKELRAYYEKNIAG